MDHGSWIMDLPAGPEFKVLYKATWALDLMTAAPLHSPFFFSCWVPGGPEPRLLPRLCSLSSPTVLLSTLCSPLLLLLFLFPSRS